MKGEQELDVEWNRLLDLYVCGEHLQDHAFCNAVVNAICEKAKTIDRYPRTLGIRAYRESAPSLPSVNCWSICLSRRDKHLG